jgi:hypothetical protein
MGAQMLILIGAGAAVLVVGSVVLTVFLINRPTSTPAPSANVASTTVSKPATPAVDLNAPSPVIVAPAIPKLVVAATEPTPAPTPAATALGPVESTSPETKPTVEPPAAAPTPASGSPAVAAASAPSTAAASTPAPGEKPTETQIQTFVDSIRVAGIRSSGGGSKVLMNERVYKVNDVVNRGLGLKLVKVEPEQLTFSDANGVIYVKTF